MIEKREQNISNYLNSIDFSLINDTDVLNNIYKEITPSISSLCKDPFVSSSLEKLIQLSNSTQLLDLLSKIDRKIVYKKLGSRIIEKIFERLFDCMYKNEEIFEIEKAINFLNFKECIPCHNATFVLRKALMLVSGKYIEKLKIEKYKPAGCKDKIINEIKAAYSSMIEDIHSTDAFNTLGIFLQISRSQSLIETIIKNDCSPENIKNKGFFYEILPTVASKKNLQLIFNQIKGNFLELSLCEQSSYFVQSFLRHSSFGVEIYNEIKEEIDNFDPNSNVILSIVESLQNNVLLNKHQNNVLLNKNDSISSVKIMNEIIENFYKIEKSVFEDFLLSRHGTIDSKYINLIVNFMKMPSKYNYNVNRDFLRFFNKEYLKNKSGIKLLVGFIEGSFDQKEKGLFLEKNIDFLWNCCKWKEGKGFIKTVCNLTRGHSRKKAFEILAKFSS